MTENLRRLPKVSIGIEGLAESEGPPGRPAGRTTRVREGAGRGNTVLGEKA